MANTEPEVARNAELTPQEAIIALDFHANKAAKAGNYGLHDDLHAASNCIDELLARIETLELRKPRAAELMFFRDEPPIPRRDVTFDADLEDQ